MIKCEFWDHPKKDQLPGHWDEEVLLDYKTCHHDKVCMASFKNIVNGDDICNHFKVCKYRDNEPLERVCGCKYLRYLKRIMITIASVMEFQITHCPFCGGKIKEES